MKKEYHYVHAELSNSNKEVLESLLISKNEIKTETLLDEIYEAVFAKHKEKGLIFVVELLTIKEFPLVSLYLEPSVHKLSEIVEYLKSELAEHGRE